MTVNVSNEEIVILAGQTQKRNLPGAQVVCYQSSAEVLVSMDGRGWLPFSRGIELNEPDGKFEDLYFKNTTGNTVTLEIAVISGPRVFVDRRELAAQVALDGVSVQVVNSPYVKEGGVVKRFGPSLYSVNHNTIGAAGALIEIVNGSLAPNGIRVTNAQFVIYQGPVDGSSVSLITTPSNSGAVLGTLMMITHKANGMVADKNDWHLEPYQSLRLGVDPEFNVTVQLNYEIL